MILKLKRGNKVCLVKHPVLSTEMENLNADDIVEEARRVIVEFSNEMARVAEVLKRFGLDPAALRAISGNGAA